MMPADDDMAKLLRERREAARAALLSAAVADVSMFIEKAIDSRLRSKPKRVERMDRRALLEVRAVRDRVLGALPASIEAVLEQTLNSLRRQKQKDPAGEAAQCVNAIADLAEARVKSTLIEIDALTTSRRPSYELAEFCASESLMWRWHQLAALGRAEQEPTGIDLRLYLPEAVSDSPVATRSTRGHGPVVRRR
jgi:hypothetical protein